MTMPTMHGGVEDFGWCSLFCTLQPRFNCRVHIRPRVKVDRMVPVEEEKQKGKRPLGAANVQKLQGVKQWCQSQIHTGAKRYNLDKVSVTTLMFNDKLFL